jgi:drug/metabolite transporter (DMT)-like permease
VTYRQYLVLAAIVLFGSCGDACLSYAMRRAGPVSMSDPLHVVGVLFTPWVALGTLLLIAFFASYLSALSWADLTYVLPATSLGYVVLALLAQFVLHENVSATRWVGILLISGGVMVVTRGPALTTPQTQAKEAD